MNEVMERQSGALAAPEKSYFEQYADAVEQNRIVGDLLKFSKGDWLSGKDGDDVPAGTRLVVHMGEFLHGWVRWSDGKPTDQMLGKVVEGHKPPKRNELGDLDKDLWEIDDASKEPRDPWQFTNYLLMKEEGGDRLYTFTTSSKGGMAAVAALARIYGAKYRQSPNAAPIVELGVDSYAHSDKKRGRIKVPVLKVVGWTTDAVFADALAAAAEDDGAADEPPFDDFPGNEAIAATAKGGGKPKPSAAPKTQF